jgi:predicted dehydrogenase
MKRVDLVMITTRHNQHARLIIEALNAGKHVFVVKTLGYF